MDRLHLAWALLAALAASSCAPDVKGPSQPAAAGNGSESTPTPTDTSPGTPGPWQPGVLGDARAAGYMPLRQLNRVEYGNAATELFGDGLSVSELLPGDVAGTSGFATAGLASEVTVQALQQAAEKLAAAADLALLTGCSAATADDKACIDSLLTGFGARAFRRPLADGERAEYLALYTSLRSDLQMSFEPAARAVVEAILQSPGFLYHWELGPTAPSKDADGVIELRGYELASRLSFLLWSSIPDRQLLDAAQSGTLGTAAGMESEARRLLASDKALATMRNFTLQWLDVSLKGATKSPELYPAFKTELATAMEDELVAFSSALYRDGGTIQQLFLSPLAFASPPLAQLYGVTGAPGAPQMLDATRPGLLTRAGFLASTSNAYEGDPTKRGAAIRKRLLCGTLVPPPANVPPLPVPSPSQTVRERHAMHMGVEPCKTCHQLTDPIGFGLGNFDAIGAYQTLDGGKPIDPSGFIANLDGAEPSFTDVTGLMTLLSNSEDVRACLTKQWLRFGFARSESDADTASLEGTYQAFASSGFQLSELLIAFTRSRSFRFRAVSPGEVVQ